MLCHFHRFFGRDLFLDNRNVCADGKNRQIRSFEKDLSRHGAFGIEYQRAVAFLPEIFIHGAADFLDGVFDAAHQQLVAFFYFILDFARRMLDDHVGKIRADALVQQDDAVVVRQERSCQVADCSD